MTAKQTINLSSEEATFLMSWKRQHGDRLVKGRHLVPDAQFLAHDGLCVTARQVGSWIRHHRAFTTEGGREVRINRHGVDRWVLQISQPGEPLPEPTL